MLAQPIATFKSHYKTWEPSNLIIQQKNAILHKPRPYSTGNNQLAAAPATFPHRCMMAKNTQKVTGSNWHWTNERHVHFLNSMEASFVQSMFENNGRFPPLDRYLPDTSESTEDLGKDRRRRHFVSDNVESSGRRTEKKTRILSCQKSCQDQVVPQFQNERDDKDKDDKDHLDASLGTAH